MCHTSGHCGPCRDSRKKEKELLFLNVCYCKIKGKHKKGTANLIVEGSFIYNYKKDKSIATEEYR